MKNHALFSSKDKSKKLKCRLLHFSFGALRVKGQNLQCSQYVLLSISAIATGAYEKVCILFNIAALMTQIAEVTNHDSDEGLKTTAKYFQVL